MGNNGLSAVPALIDELKNTDEKMKLAAISALGGLGPIAAAARRPLILLSEDHPKLKKQVDGALATINTSVLVIPVQ